MNIMTRQIVDVYHAHAHLQGRDEWSKLHIHGLNENFLKANGFPNESVLINDFKKWLRGKDILAMYANNPHKEKTVLQLPVLDINLPGWAERSSLISHKTALAFKRNSIPIVDRVCPAEAHSAFKFYPVFRHSPTELAKKDFGHHCSLYDTYALYLHYVLD